MSVSCTFCACGHRRRSHDGPCRLCTCPGHTDAPRATHPRRPYSAPQLRWYERGIIAWANKHVRPYVEETTRKAELAARYLGVLTIAGFLLSLPAAAHAQDRSTAIVSMTVRY